MAAISHSPERKGITIKGHRVGLGDADAMTQRRSHNRKPTSGITRKQ